MSKQQKEAQAVMKQHMGLKASQRLSNTIVYILLVIMAVVWLIPFVLIVLQSFRIENTERVGYILPKQWGIKNYKDLFDTAFPKWYLNTFIIALVQCVVQTIIVLCMAYTLSRFRFKSRGKLMRFMMILGMFPGMLTMLILYNVLSDLNLTGEHAVPGLILVYVFSTAASMLAGVIIKKPAEKVSPAIVEAIKKVYRWISRGIMKLN